MKFVTLLTALTAAALAQDPQPEKPATDKALEKPAEAPSVNKPDLKPSAPDPKPAPSTLKPTPPDLPTLPATGNETDLTKGQPGARLKPAPEKVTGTSADTDPTKKTPAIGTVADRPKTRTTLRAPVTATDLDLRIRYRQAQSKAASEPAVQALWEQSRLSHTDYDKRETMKSYYQLLYKRMLAMDKAIAPLVEDRQRYNIRRLTQSRIDPTDPLEEENRLRQY